MSGVTGREVETHTLQGCSESGTLLEGTLGLHKAGSVPIRPHEGIYCRASMGLSTIEQHLRLGPD